MPANDTNHHGRKPRTSDASTLLERGRTCFERHEWEDAFAVLSRADASTALGAEDLYRLAWSAGLTGRDEEMLAATERWYHALINAGESLPAARAAFWLGFRLLARGDASRAGGWLGRAQHLVEREGRDCVEQGYLLLPAAARYLTAGKFAEAHDAAARAVQFGERFEEADLLAFARNLQARALLSQGQFDRGLALMDEAMVAVISGELSAVVTGVLYCSSIGSCQRIYAYERTREWTAALSRWCDAHPQLGMFTAYCLAHRAEIMQMGGNWPEAVGEARRAVERCVRAIEQDAAGRAHYQEAEIHRLRGEFDLADASYRDASRCGVDPQPGLALLRLAQGDIGAAANAIRRAVGATHERLARIRFLPASVEIMLAAGNLEEARAASHELDEAASTLNTEVPTAIALHARAAILLAEGNALAAVDPLRQAFRVWQQLDAPFLAARLRVQLAQACVALDDTEGGRLELEAARDVFERLGARPDLAVVEAIAAGLAQGKKESVDAHGLTGRELQVLRLIASGKTNKAIARELSLSEKTIDRHVSNIFTKLNVSSRAAATAFAYQHQLL
jgi:ATP/maltotriose-dependent transcriptional regulator MalT